MQSCIAFVVGTYIAESGSKNTVVVQNDRKKVQVCIIATVGFILSNVVIYGIRHFWKDVDIIRVIFGSISTASFVVMLILLLSKARIENSALKQLGKISTEIYLSHQLVINIARYYFLDLFESRNTIGISIAILFTVMLISWIIKRIEKKIPELLGGKRV